MKSDRYGWLRYADILGLTEKNLVTVPPGSVCRIGPQGENSGIIFQPTPEKPLLFGNVTRHGTHRGTVSYTNREDGKKFNLQKVWTGTVTAKEVVLNVK